MLGGHSRWHFKVAGLFLLPFHQVLERVKWWGFPFIARYKAAVRRRLLHAVSAPPPGLRTKNAQKKPGTNPGFFVCSTGLFADAECK